MSNGIDLVSRLEKALAGHRKATDVTMENLISQSVPGYKGQITSFKLVTEGAELDGGRTSVKQPFSHAERKGEQNNAMGVLATTINIDKTPCNKDESNVSTEKEMLRLEELRNRTKTITEVIKTVFDAENAARSIGE